MPSKKVLFADETENDVFDLLTPKDTFRVRKEDQRLSARLQKDLLVKGQFRCFEYRQLVDLSSMSPQELKEHTGSTLQEAIRIQKLLFFYLLSRQRAPRMQDQENPDKGVPDDCV